MRNPRTKLILVALLALFITSVTARTIHAQQPANGKSSSTSYHLLKRIEVGGEGGWDYLTVDADARRLYVSHGTRVVVVDLDKGTVVGEIPNTNGVHGIAIAPELGRGFTSNGRDSTATIFDLKTLKALGQAKTAKNPDAIIEASQTA